MWILDELKKLSISCQPAIIHREESISFAELWVKSDKAAIYLQKACKSKSPIVIYGNKDIDINIIMLASLKAGHAYVPLDVTYPVKRVEEIMQEVENEIIFNFSSETIPLSSNYKIIDKQSLHSLYDEIIQVAASQVEYISMDDNCYILFTSGSTGKAKGVPITRRNIENFTAWFSEICQLPAGQQAVLNQVSYSFDVSVIPLYIYMSQGKTLFSIDKEMMDNTRVLFSYLEKSQIAAWISTPAFLEMCCYDDGFGEVMLSKLETIILAGEVLTKQLVKNLRQKFGKAKVINGYGPTEGTVLLSACVITDSMLEDEKNLPIGRIVSDGEYKICDADSTLVKPGDTGELIVVSDSISKGYFKDMEQTQKAFFAADNGKMGYRTGDLVFVEDGLLYYVARKDTQVKLNGFRIELSDISANLNKLSMVNNSVVLPVYKNERVSYLVGLVTLNERIQNLSDLKMGIELKRQLKEFIPSYMIPRKMIILEKFPMNINGKIDRKKLIEVYL